MRIIWFKHQGLGCRFEDLFEPMNDSGIILKEAMWVDKLLLDRPRIKNFYVPRIYQQFGFKDRLYEQQITPLRNKNFNFREWAEFSPIYMSSYTLFYAFPGEMLRNYFIPVESIQQKLQQQKSSFNHETIGIHIRRTDHIIAIKESPTELFFRNMDEHIDKWPEARFYLATDSREEKKQFIKRYGSRIQTTCKEADRTSIEGMRDAVKEFFLLSHCKEIWGSFDSSFSEMAAYMGGIPLKVVKKKK